MSSSAGNAEGCKDPSLSSPNGYALRSKGPLPQPQKRSGPRCKYSRHQPPPGIAPAYEYGRSYQDPENIPILENLRLLELSEIFAEAALSYLNQQGHQLELFRLDYYEGGVVGGGARFHHNFLARPAHDPGAPPDTIFSQMFLRHDSRLGAVKDLTVECCVSLGPSHSLPKKRDNRGCVFCSIYIHHPKDACEGMIC